MSYTSYENHFVYKQLLTYQEMNVLGANDAYFKTGDASVSGSWTFAGNVARLPLKAYTYAQMIALSSPAAGELFWCSDQLSLYVYDGTNFVAK